MKRSAIVTVIVSVYLVAGHFLIRSGNFSGLSIIVSALFPFLVIWMGITILKDKSQAVKELGEEEWGYGDRKKSELGIF